MRDKKRGWINYECLHCDRVSPRMRKQKSGIIVCTACGYPVKKLREAK